MQLQIEPKGVVTMSLKKSEDPAYRLPAERRRPKAEQSTTQSRRDKTKPEQHK